MTDPARTRAIAMMVVAAICWSSGGYLVRQLALRDAWEIVFWRSVFMALFVLGVLVAMHRRRTAAAVRAAGLGAPTYVITGWGGSASDAGGDDLATAELIERARLGQPLREAETARVVATSDEAARTLAIGVGHVHPEDVDRAVTVDAFAFAMEVTRTPVGLRLDRVDEVAPVDREDGA